MKISSLSKQPSCLSCVPHKPAGRKSSMHTQKHLICPSYCASCFKYLSLSKLNWQGSLKLLSAAGMWVLPSHRSWIIDSWFLWFILFCFWDFFWINKWQSRQAVLSLALCVLFVPLGHACVVRFQVSGSEWGITSTVLHTYCTITLWLHILLRSVMLHHTAISDYWSWKYCVFSGICCWKKGKSGVNHSPVGQGDIVLSVGRRTRKWVTNGEP